MSKQKLLLLTTCISLSLSASAAYSKQTLYQLGNTPFSTPLATVEDLQTMVSSHPDDLREGFDLAGQPQLYQPFMNQINTADIKTIELDKGSTMDWMLYRKKGVVKITRDVTWGAEEPFTAFSFYVDYEGKRYNMIVPWKCANLTLVNIAEAPAEMVTEPVAPVVQPVADNPAPMVEEDTFKNFHEIFDIGFMYEANAATYLPIRFGGEYSFDENFSVMGLLGGTPQLGDTDGASGFLIDVIATYRINKFSMGLGLGGWLSSMNNGANPEDSRLDAIAELGYQIYSGDSNTTEIYVEGRSGVDEFDDFDQFARISTGLRFRF